MFACVAVAVVVAGCVCFTHSPAPLPVVLLQDLGAAALSKRPTSCMLVLPKPIKGGADDDEAKEFGEAYAEVEKKIKAAMPVF